MKDGAQASGAPLDGFFYGLPDDPFQRLLAYEALEGGSLGLRLFGSPSGRAERLVSPMEPHFLNVGQPPLNPSFSFTSLVANRNKMRFPAPIRFNQYLNRVEAVVGRFILHAPRAALLPQCLALSATL